MSKKIAWAMIGWCCLFALWLTVGCGGMPVEPTLTFSNDACSYSGPTKIPSEFQITWAVEENEHPAAIYAIVTLDPGKSVEELSKIPAEEPPPAWVHKLSYDTALTAGTFTKSFDLGSNASFQGGSIYMVCFYADQSAAFGAVGPIEVRD